MVAFSALVLGGVQRQTRAATERGLLDTARAISVAVDRELGGTIAALKLLATSEPLGSRDLKAFHQAAHVAVVTQSTWQNVVLYAASGQPLVDTLLPFGAPAPTGANREPAERAVRGGIPAISDLFVERVTHRPLISVVIPVREEGTSGSGRDRRGARRDPASRTAPGRKPGRPGAGAGPASPLAARVRASNGSPQADRLDLTPSPCHQVPHSEGRREGTRPAPRSRPMAEASASRWQHPTPSPRVGRRRDARFPRSERRVRRRNRTCGEVGRSAPKARDDRRKGAKPPSERLRTPSACGACRT